MPPPHRQRKQFAPNAQPRTSKIRSGVHKCTEQLCPAPYQWLQEASSVNPALNFCKTGRQCDLSHCRQSQRSSPPPKTWFIGTSASRHHNEIPPPVKFLGYHRSLSGRTSYDDMVISMQVADQWWPLESYRTECCLLNS